MACWVCSYKLPKELAEFKLMFAVVQKLLFLLALLHSLNRDPTSLWELSQ